MPYQKEFYHHGKEGMRWGKLNGPPYPIGSGPKQSMAEREEAAEKRKREWKIFSRNKSKDKKNKKETSEEDKKLTPEEEEQEKKRVMRSGTASEISKYADKMTTNELNEAMSRYRINSEIRRSVIREEEEKKNKGFNEIDKVMKKAKTVSDWANTAKSYYTIGKYFLNELNKDDKVDKNKKDDKVDKNKKDDTK